jgi:serine/threonine protein kinase
VIGTTIDGRYQVRRLLGRGGMGVVYEAHHLGLDRTVALKILEHTGVDRDLVTRFRREARAASRIVHPNVVQIFDVGSADGIDYIAMEYVEGEDLGRILRDGGPLEPARAIAVTRQLLDGLQAIHDGGIIHRDIKPGNVILTAREDGTEVVKIMDFGIAKSINASVALTAPGHAIGTANYMAPEQVLGGAIDHRADLYAAGITLYAMLVGEEPFGGATFTRVARKQLTDDIPSLDEVRPDLPRALVAAVTRAVAKSPSARFPDALAFAAALDREAPPAERSSATARDMTETVPQRGSRASHDPEAPNARDMTETVPQRGSRASQDPEAPNARDVTETVQQRGSRVPPAEAAPSPPEHSSTATRTPEPASAPRWLLAAVAIGASAIVIALGLAWDRARDGEPVRDHLAIADDPPRDTRDEARPVALDARAAALDARVDAIGVVVPPPPADAPPADATLFDARAATTRVRPRVTPAVGESPLDASTVVPDGTPAIPIDAAVETAVSAIDAGVPTPPARQPRAPVGARPSEGPVTRCGCWGQQGYLCKRAGPLLCDCEAPREGPLCSVPFTKCTDPGCTSYKVCSDRSFTNYRYAATPGASCAGYARSAGNRLITGAYYCGVCNNLLQYTGEPGTDCEGFSRHAGTPAKGYVSCL